ncbi:MAG: DUF3310 domain-containing protein [Schwartzia sp.]|nr:DUF3310 domain-containing protein [Schwartzia sp. (in: firmicutes)]
MATISTGRARHDTPILKKDDLSQLVSAPCHTRKAKTWEIIKAHSETGLTVKQISEKMGISENTIANAARNHSFEIRDEDGPVNGSSYIRKHLEYQPPKRELKPKPEPPKPEPLPKPEPPKVETTKYEIPEPQPLPGPVHDPVNHPKHYMLPSGVEVIDIIEAVCGEGVDEYYRGNIIKYICRYKEKGGAESLRKARWYLDRLIMLQETREELGAEA